MENNRTTTGMVFSTGNSAAVNYNAGVPVAPQREVDAVLEAQGAEIDLLAKVLSELEDRLRMVLILVPGVASSDSGPQVSRFGCVLANSIDARTGCIKSNRERIESMLANLQL